MDELLPICLHCSRLVRCQHLSDSGGKCIVERVITEDRYRECPDWLPIELQKKRVRDKMYNLFGLGYLRCAHSEFPDQETDITLNEGELYAMIMDRERPDFYAMLYQGITTTERDTQLRYQTDETGQFKVAVGPDGSEIALVRPDYELKGYAMDPEGPIKAGRSVMFADVNQTIDHILKTEVAAGLVIKAKKPKAPSAPQEEERETLDMPPVQKGTVVQTRVVSNRPGGAPVPGNVRPPVNVAAGAPSPKRANPKPPAGPQGPANTAPAPSALPKPVPTQAGPSGPGGPGGRVSRPVRPSGPPSPQQQQAPAEAGQGGFDLEGLAVMTANVVEAKTAEQLAAFRGEVLAAIDSLRSLVLDVTGIAFDMAVQTNGTYQYAQMDEKNNYVVDEQGNAVMVSLPQISRKKGRLLTFADQSAYTAPDEPQEGQPQGE